MSLTPEVTWYALLTVQTLHLLHHVLAKRHISVVEVLASATLLIPFPIGAAAGTLLMILHIGLIVIQLVGSIWIRRLSPSYGDEKNPQAALG